LIVSSYLNKHWFVTSLLLLPVLGITLFYAPLHLWLGVPVKNLFLPFAIFCLIEPLTTRAIYWAQSALMSTSDTQPLYLVTCLYCSVFFLGAAFFGTRWGFFEPTRLARNCLIAVLLGLSIGPIGYYANRWMFPGKKAGGM
jgi:hypothetical protein